MPRSKKTGMPPGSLIFTGKNNYEKVKIQLIDYTQTKLQEKELKNVEECFPFKNRPTVTWLNITGVHEVDIVEKIGKYFGLHPLMIEDILTIDQRPKIEDFDKGLFIIFRMLSYDEKKSEVNSEQVSLIIGKHFVISFQETEGDIFDPIRKRIRNARGRIRNMNSDYLAYALLDILIDNYFTILEKIGEKVEDTEEKLLEDPDIKTINTIHILKRDLIILRKSVWPLREVISKMQRSGSKLIHRATQVYLRDLYDHTIQVIDTIETLKDTTSSMLEVYLSSISNKMNEVMKVLTMFASIFIPLTFIVGVYGMNFKFMPELNWKYSYFVVWGVIIAVGLSMLFHYKRKGWI
jgi:magnesium transporter